MTLIGHNGAGKSTIIKYMLKLYQQCSQHSFLDSLAPHLTQVSADVKVGFAPEIPALEVNCSAKDYITWLSFMRGRNDFDEIAKELAFNVDLKKPINEYSKGMRQLLSLCLAFFGKPDLIVLDEPTSGLDPFVSERVQSFVCKRAKTQNLIIATHSLEFAFNLGMEIWILRKGKIAHKKIYEDFNELKQDFWSSKP
jgi:ABC-2 type transport system ATP-binding protein